MRIVHEWEFEIMRIVHKLIDTRAYKYRIYPTKKQKDFLDKHFGCSRFVYNFFLRLNKELYKKHNLSFNRYFLQALLPYMKKGDYSDAKWEKFKEGLKEKGLKYYPKKTPDELEECFLSIKEMMEKDKYEWLTEVGSSSLICSMIHLEKAFKKFFKEPHVGFPKFKSKFGSRASFTTQHVSLNGNYARLPKIPEGIKIEKHRDMIGDRDKNSTVNVSKTPSGKYFISFVVKNSKHKQIEKTNSIIGCDLGIKKLLTGVVSNSATPLNINTILDSDIVKIENNKYFKKYEEKLAMAQEHLSRKVKGSNRYKKQKIKVAKIHEKITNLRKDYLHKLSHEFITKYGTLIFENLDIKEMVDKKKNKKKKHYKIAKHITDSSWGMFLDFINYKADWNDRKFIKIDKTFPSTKKCHICGDINEKLKLSDRIWTCKNGHVLDRDLNASINIFNEGIRILQET